MHMRIQWGMSSARYDAIGAQSLEGNLAPVKMFWPENSPFP
jgi:hypothetical protein